MQLGGLGNIYRGNKNKLVLLRAIVVDDAGATDILEAELCIRTHVSRKCEMFFFGEGSVSREKASG